MTGGVAVTSDPDRWQSLKAAWAIFQTVGVETAQLVTPEEAHKVAPIADMTGILGGLYDQHEGYLDPHGTTHAYAGAARKRGAEVILQNRVLELHQRPDGWEIVTEKGTIHAEHVVNCGGLWAKQVGLMAGVDLPVTPLEHHYLVTEEIPEVAALPEEMGTFVDMEGFTYMRQERAGMLLGFYELNPKHWNMEGAPWNYGMELIPEDLDRIEHEIQTGFARYPCLETAGIRRWVNGAFTFTPDGNPLVGPVPGKPGYWVACGVMAGFSQGGGVGKTLAEWMIHGEPEGDVFGMDIARYGAFAANREYLRQTTAQFYSRRFVMTYPNERLPAGRPLRRPGAYDAMTAAGARWMGAWGLELPAYFAPDGFEETPTLRRSNAFDIVGAEVRATREACGMLDTSGFSRFEVTGPGAEAWLDRLLACRLPAPGPRPSRPHARPGRAAQGRPDGPELGRRALVADGLLLPPHLAPALVRRPHGADGVRLTDLSDTIQGFSIQGPNARAILEVASGQPVDLPFMGCTTLGIGMVTAPVARLSVAGRTWLRDQLPRLGTRHPPRDACWRRVPTTGSARSAITRSTRSAWRRASASGRASSPKATPPP